MDTLEVIQILNRMIEDTKYIKRKKEVLFSKLS